MSAALVIRRARVLTLRGERPRRREALGELGVVEGADVLIEGGRVIRVEPDVAAPGGARVIEAGGRVLMPAFVDCHTHACWAGDRLDEWERKQRGASYLELLEAGGGIMATVRAVRRATEAELAERLLERLDAMGAGGTATVEVKSGYGLDAETELKMLRAIAGAAAVWPGTVIPTACIGHALDPDVDDDVLVDRTIAETLPAVHAAFPGVAIDAYCERGAWSVDACVRLFEAAGRLGHPVRIHADQFNSLGMVAGAIGLGAVSVDHLEATTPDDLRALAESETYGVMLPCSGFHLDGRYADGRGFVDMGGTLALASNYNPGSAPCGSMAMGVALAVRHLGLTAAEAITACTANAAALLGLRDRGSIEPGARADLVLLRHRDERQLGYEFGGNPAMMTVIGGTIIGPVIG